MRLRALQESFADAPNQARSLVNETRVKLDERGAGIEFFQRIVWREDAADGDHGHFAACGDKAHDFRRTFSQGMTAQSALRAARLGHACQIDGCIAVSYTHLRAHETPE